MRASVKGMGTGGNDKQIYFVGGLLLGVAVFGLLVASGGESLSDFINRWQELTAGILGAAVTLFGARMIVEQIRADDSREERKARQQTIRTADAMISEIEVVLDRLVSIQADLDIMAELSEVAGFEDGKSHSFPINNLDVAQNATFRRINGKKPVRPQLTRLDHHLAHVAMVGSGAGELAVGFRDMVAELPVQASVFGHADRKTKTFAAGVRGERAILALRHVASTGELILPQNSLVDNNETLREAIASWRKRVVSARLIDELGF